MVGISILKIYPMRMKRSKNQKERIEEEEDGCYSINIYFFTCHQLFLILTYEDIK